MKKIVISLLVVSIVGVFGCKKLDELTQFYMDYDTEVVLPANSAINLPIPITSPDIATNYEESFSANDTRKDLIQEIKIDRISITVQNPPGQNLNFLKSIEVYISADGLDEIQVASKYDIPDGLTELELDYISDNLKPYLTKETIKIRTKTVMDEPLKQDTELKIHNRFWVNAEVLGI